MKELDIFGELFTPTSTNHNEVVTAVEKLGETIKSEFKDGMQWEELLAISPRVIDSARTISKKHRFNERQIKVLAVMIIDWLVDNTDGWGPDSVIDPVIKFAARSYLLV